MADATVPAANDAKDIKFFGEIDFNHKGQVSSMYPSYYFPQMAEDLREDIRQTKHQLDSGLVPKQEEGIHRQRLIDKEAKLRNIERAVPNLSGKDKDRIATIRQELGGKISESMFSYDDMQRGIADPYREMQRMMDPCIKLSPEAAQIAQSMNVRVHKGGMVSRNAAEKMWKIASKTLGENSITEALRRRTGDVSW